jgi:hypothetical protein
VADVSLALQNKSFSQSPQAKSAGRGMTRPSIKPQNHDAAVRNSVYYDYYPMVPGIIEAEQASNTRIDINI